MPPEPITIAILAMGGEGGGVLADWLVAIAEGAGYHAQTTSVPGVAQRTGSTIYYLELFPADASRDAGQDAVLALMPVPGEVDVVVASELMEAGRAVQRGLVTSQRTTFIVSSHRVYSMTEKTAVTDGRVDAAGLLEEVRAAAKALVCADFAGIARESGSVISAALLGALAASRCLPFERSCFEAAIRGSGVGVDASLRAFAEGWEAAVTPAGPAPPSSAPDVVSSAIERLTDYQDARYAAEFLALLEPIQALNDPVLFEQTARYLALWMSYEDAIRVAALKTAARRFERVRGESRAAHGQLLRIHDYVFPRVGEIADILPARVGEWLLRTGWARGLVERVTRTGKVIETTSIRGFLRLYAVAALRPWRRQSLRYRREHRKIAQWLNLVAEVSHQDIALARELAECPRLIKGYGDTHARGMQAYDTLMAELPRLRQLQNPALHFRKLREAALAGLAEKG